tara:strand:- start:208 stop:702 length:495 start_codon:yes stop_codon:yes gene_type:complete
MGRKKNFLNKLVSKEISNLNNNFFIYTYINIEDGVGFLNVNSNFDLFTAYKLSEVINKTDYENVILIARNEKEQFSEPFPPTQDFKKFIKKLKKNVKVFYQDPWPAKVPSFLDNKNTMIIRFGYDEGCEYDKLCVNNPSFDTTEKEGKYFFLLNKNKSELIHNE